MLPRDKIRNIAIVAHIDHGKTTLLDALLRQFQMVRGTQERMMDSYDQEKERGITIFSKHTSVRFGDFKINIVDTPGHADFSGEVERVLGMVDGVLLLVDAAEGPMPQTRFVLTKALRFGLTPLVVINKIDKPAADPDNALNLTFDLFVELGANDEQLGFTHCYASGVNGFAMRELEDERKDMRPLLELVTEKIPAPKGEEGGPFLMQVATLQYDDYLGRQACGRIMRGELKANMPVVKVDRAGEESSEKVARVQVYEGLQLAEVPSAGVGEIVRISGIEEVTVGDTLCAPEKIEHLPAPPLDEPTISLAVRVNTSPLSGRDGKHVTMNKIRERLERECRANISLRIESSSNDEVILAGRGELHLSVVVEAMRREGFELSLGKPRVLVKEIDGQKCEPMERAEVEVPSDFQGVVIEQLCQRGGELEHLELTPEGLVQMRFLIPTRGLMGYRNTFLTITKGEGILAHLFDSYQPWKGSLKMRTNGSLVATAPGKATTYALDPLQARGVLYIEPGTEVYKGMVVGENNRAGDLGVNVAKEKKLTNVRAAGKDEQAFLAPPRRLNLELAMDLIQDDEWIEVTPKHLRLRKAVL
ncbi:MAG: translational GTPase TypA [Parachlamydiales bacterium]